MPWRIARSLTRVSALSRASGRSKAASSSSIRPASILDRSRMSLMSESRCRPEESMSCRYSSCLSLSSPNMRSSSASEKPMMALSGVRSSWDMLARNSDLCRFAISSCVRLLAQLLEQAGVLDGDDGLVAERPEDLDLLVRERPRRAPGDRDHADRRRRRAASAPGGGSGNPPAARSRASPACRRDRCRYPARGSPLDPGACGPSTTGRRPAQGSPAARRRGPPP